MRLTRVHTPEREIVGFISVASLSSAFTALAVAPLVRAAVRALTLLAACSLAACAPQPTPALFVAPTAQALVLTVAPPAASPTLGPTQIPPPTPARAASSPTPCTNDLSFVQDVSVPDGTSVAPGERVDKRWLVTNTGTCNWDASYRLKLITGDPMDAPTEHVLYPARAGTQATLGTVFTAPQLPGDYSSTWQAVAPDGTAFGQLLSLHIIVAP